MVSQRNTVVELSTEVTQEVEFLFKGYKKNCRRKGKTSLSFLLQDVGIEY